MTDEQRKRIQQAYERGAGARAQLADMLGRTNYDNDTYGRVWDERNAADTAFRDLLSEIQRELAMARADELLEVMDLYRSKR